MTEMTEMNEMTDPITIFIVDDHRVVRKGLKMFLESDTNLVVCGEAEGLKDALELISHNKPDVVLLDYKLPDGDGIIGCLNIKNMFPNMKVIILTAYADDEVITAAIRAGADAYLLKDIDGEELIATIYSVYKGRAAMDSLLSDDASNQLRCSERKHGANFNLNEKEITILDMIAMGQVNKEIAYVLKISDKTVRNYISKIFKKINVSNRTEAASFWIRQKTTNKE